MKIHNASKRLLDIIEYLATTSDATIDEMSSKTHIPYTTIYRILQTLVRLEYVEFTPQNKYRLTHKLYSITAAYINHFLPVSSIAHPHLRKLYYMYGETIHLGTLSDNKILYVDKVDSKHKLRMHSYIGYKADFHCTGLGKALISYLDEKDLTMLLDHTSSLSRHTPNTITSKEALKKEITKIRAQGYAEDNEEHEIGLYCLAVPIFDTHNQVVASISISIPTFRHAKDKKMTIIKSLWEHAAALSSKLNNRDYHACLKRKV